MDGIGFKEGKCGITMPGDKLCLHGQMRNAVNIDMGKHCRKAESGLYYFGVK